jgi:hypothetical protein
VNKFGRHHILEKLVRNFRGGNHSSHGKIPLGVVENIPHQKRFARILLTDDDHHWTFLGIDLASIRNHSDIKLAQLKVHCSLGRECLYGFSRVSVALIVSHITKHIDS